MVVWCQAACRIQSAVVNSTIERRKRKEKKENFTIGYFICHRSRSSQIRFRLNNITQCNSIKNRLHLLYMKPKVLFAAKMCILKVLSLFRLCSIWLSDTHWIFKRFLKDSRLALIFVSQGFDNVNSRSPRAHGECLDQSWPQTAGPRAQDGVSEYSRWGSTQLWLCKAQIQCDAIAS